MADDHEFYPLLMDVTRHVLVLEDPKHEPLLESLTEWRAAREER